LDLSVLDLITIFSPFKLKFKKIALNHLLKHYPNRTGINTITSKAHIKLVLSKYMKMS